MRKGIPCATLLLYVLPNLLNLWCGEQTEDPPYQTDDFHVCYSDLQDGSYRDLLEMQVRQVCCVIDE